MPILGREALEQRAVETKAVTIAEWGGDILLRKLSATEMSKRVAMLSSAFNRESNAVTDPERFVRGLAIGLFWSWVDEQGQQVLTDTKDIDRLCKESFETLNRINDAINEWNNLDLDAVKKNSAKTQNDDYGIT